MHRASGMAFMEICRKAVLKAKTCFDMRFWVYRAIRVPFFIVLAGFLTSCTDNTNFRPVPPVIPEVVPPVAVTAPDTACSCGPVAPVPAPATVDTTLPKPVFSLRGGLSQFGQVVSLRVDALPAQTVYEYSWDNGKNWVQGDSLKLCRSGTITARIRRQNISSPVARETFTLYYKRVLIVGNSITYHGADNSIGWGGTWGMAASRADSDYVHRLTRKLRDRHPEVQVKLYNAVPFESDFASYDLKKVDEYVSFQPDLIIMRIAENTSVTAATESVFREKYEALIKKLRSSADTKVVCTTSFWPGRYDAEQAIRAVASKNRYDLVELGGYFDDKSYTAMGLFKDLGVANHPGDKGMRVIYQAIVDKL
jgi:hypothetical protein